MSHLPVKGFPCCWAAKLPNAEHAFGFFQRFLAHFLVAARMLHVGDVAKVADLFDLLHIYPCILSQLAVHDDGTSNHLPPFAVFPVLTAQRFVDGGDVFGASAGPSGCGQQQGVEDDCE